MTYDNELIDLIDIWTELYYMTDKRIHEVRRAILKGSSVLSANFATLSEHRVFHYLSHQFAYVFML